MPVVKKNYTDGLEDDSNLIDKFQNVAVVDTAKIFTYTDAINVSTFKRKITHLNVNSKTEFDFDELCSSYEQVQGLSKCLAHKFINSRNTHKVVFNMVD